MSLTQGLALSNSQHFANTVSVSGTPNANGSGVAVWVFGGASAVPTDSVAGSPNTYTLLAGPITFNSVHNCWLYWCQNFSNPGGGSVTFTYNPGSYTSIGIMVEEVQTGLGSGIYPVIDNLATPTANYAFSSTGTSPAATSSGAGGLAVAAFAAVSSSIAAVTDTTGWNNIETQVVSPSAGDLYPCALSSTPTTGTGSYSDTFAVGSYYNTAMFTVVFMPLAGAQLAGIGQVSADGHANLKTQAALAGTGQVAANSSANLLAESSGYASVTLTNPLFYGVGGILSAYADWSISAPGVGAVVWYDPTYLTILPNGEIVGTVNNFTALAQWYTGSAWSELTVLVTSGLSAVGYVNAQGHAVITTHIPLNAVGFVAANGLAALSSNALDQISAIGSVAANGSAALTTVIKLVATGQVSADGHALITVGAGFAATGQVSADGRANLSIASQLTGTGAVAANGHASLSVGAGLAAQGAGGANGHASLTALIQLAAQGSVMAQGSAALLAHIQFNAIGSASADGQANFGVGASFSARGQVGADGRAAINTGSLIYAIGQAAANGYADLTAQGPSQIPSIWNQVPGMFAPILGIESPPLGIWNVDNGQNTLYGIDWTIWLAQRWAPAAEVQAAYCIRPYPANGFEFICTKAGQSGADLPEWPLKAGATVIDGSVIWTAQETTSDSLLTTVQSATWQAQDLLIATGQGVQGQLTIVLINTGACQPGQSYSAKCTAKMFNGTELTGELVFQIH